jgi:hypothetical protein
MRDSFIQIKVTKEERENMRDNAKIYGLTLTSYFRMLNEKEERKNKYTSFTPIMWDKEIKKVIEIVNNLEK